jgi:hypothetical protein
MSNNSAVVWFALGLIAAQGFATWVYPKWGPS